MVPRKLRVKSPLTLKVESEDGQVVTAFGARFDRHALVVACYQSVQEAPGLVGEALFAFVGGELALDGFAAALTEADLSDDALEQLGHVVLQRRRCLDELTVEHHCTRSALWEKKDIYRERIHFPNGVSQLLVFVVYPQVYM